MNTTVADRMATKEDLEHVENRLGTIETDTTQIRIDTTTLNNRLGNIESAVGDLRATDDRIVDALASKKLLSESEAHTLHHQKPSRNLAHA